MTAISLGERSRFRYAPARFQSILALDAIEPLAAVCVFGNVAGLRGKLLSQSTIDRNGSSNLLIARQQQCPELCSWRSLSNRTGWSLPPERT
jgi:hypothetical protein